MADGNTGTEVTVEFNYDRVFIEPNLNINSENFQDNITSASKGGKYDITFANLPEDIQGGSSRESLSALYEEMTGGSSRALSETESLIQGTKDQQNEAKADFSNEINNALGASGNTLGGVDQTPNISNTRPVIPVPGI